MECHRPPGGAPGALSPAGVGQGLQVLSFCQVLCLLLSQMIRLGLREGWEPQGVAGEVNPWNCLNPCCHVLHPHQGSGESTAKGFGLGRQYLTLQGDFFSTPDKETSHRPGEDSRGDPYCRKKNCQAGTAHTCRAKRGPGHLAASPGPGPASGPCGMLSLTQMSAPPAPCCPAHLRLPILWLCISDLLLSTAGHLLPTACVGGR